MREENNCYNHQLVKLGLVIAKSAFVVFLKLY